MSISRREFVTSVTASGIVLSMSRLAIAEELGADDTAGCALDLDRRAQGLFTLLETTGKLADWAAVAELWLLSNHRHEWLRPVLEAEGLLPLFERVIISSEWSAMKPEPALYASLRDSPGVETLFVDDKQENLDVAERFGIGTLLADADGHWVEQVDVWLDLSTSRRV